MKKNRLPLLSVALLTLVLCLAAAPAQADTLYLATGTLLAPGTNIVSLDTASPTSAPTPVATGLTAGDRFLAGSCEGSLFTMSASTGGINRIDTTTGQQTLVTSQLGDGFDSNSGLAASADGKRLWWIHGKTVYTRLVSDPVPTPPTSIATVDAWATYSRVDLVRVGDKLVASVSTGNGPTVILDTATAPTTVNVVTGAAGNGYVAGDLTHAYVVHDATPPMSSDYELGSIGVATGTAKSDVAPIGVQTGPMVVDTAGSLWMVATSSNDLFKVDLATGTGGMVPTATQVIANTAYATSAAFTACPKPAAATAAPAAAAAPAPVAAAPHVAKPKPLKIFPVSGSATNPTVTMRVPGPGLVTLAGTMTSVDPLARFTGRATAPACTRVTKRVTKAGIVRVTCHVTADTQAARRLGPVKVRLIGTFKPRTGTAQSTTRVIVLRALGMSESVTG